VQRTESAAHRRPTWTRSPNVGFPPGRLLLPGGLGAGRFKRPSDLPFGSADGAAPAAFFVAAPGRPHPAGEWLPILRLNAVAGTVRGTAISDEAASMKVAIDSWATAAGVADGSVLNP